MDRWEKHWFGPVAAIRPYLFQRCFLLVVAMDLLVLMTERGARYGLNGIESFNVAHFSWLDTLHGMVLPTGIPTASYYVCVLAVTSFLAMWLVFTGHRPWLMAIVALLYTYGWSMSRLDSYLHHYMLSLILGCMIFFPPVRAQDLKDWWIESEASRESRRSRRKRKRKQKNDAQAATQGSNHLALRATILIGLAVLYRCCLSHTMGFTDVQRWISMFVFSGLLVAALSSWKANRWEDNGPLVSAWGFRLLATTVGVIYVFTSIAKMDAEWCGGHTLLQVGTTGEVLMPVEQLAGMIGVSRQTFWSMLATFVIPLELTLAAVYLISVSSDEPGRKWLRRICALGWLLAVGLHLNNEMMNLIIQWFGYYMLLLATLILLPARILMLAGLAFIWPECWIRDRVNGWADGLEKHRALIGLLVVSAIAILVLIATGFYSMIPGIIYANMLIAVGFAAVLIYGTLAGQKERLVKTALATAFVGLAMTATIWQCTMRFDYYDLRSKTLLKLGLEEESLSAFRVAIDLPAPNSREKARVITDMGLAYRQLQKEFRAKRDLGMQTPPGVTEDDLMRQAENAYRASLRTDPNYLHTHYSLGNLLAARERWAEAAESYSTAIRIKPDYSDAMVNLGNVLERLGELDKAIGAYEAALVIEPQAADIHHFLRRARECAADGKAGAGPPDRAPPRGRGHKPPRRDPPPPPNSECP